MSYTCLYFHVVFGTKERRPQVTQEILPRLREFTGGICRKIDGRLLRANGPQDHIHLAISASPKEGLAKYVNLIKANTSRWIHETFPDARSFDWQDGYGGFTVSPSVLPKLLAYIDNQIEHHKKMTFEEELKLLFEAHGIAYDPRFLNG